MASDPRGDLPRTNLKDPVPSRLRDDKDNRKGPLQGTKNPGTKGNTGAVTGGPSKRPGNGKTSAGRKSGK